MDNEKFVKWCETATVDIRYPPDRKMVAYELVGHLEDRRDALMADGLDERDATDQALESMGDAKEIAPQLGALHKPFWGYFECATRYIAYILCVALLFVGTFLLSSQNFDSLFDKKTDPYHHFNLHNTNQNLECTLDISPDASEGFDRYTFTADRLAMWQWTEHSDASGILCVKLDIRDNTLLTESCPFVQYLWIEDSLGNRYYNLQTIPADEKRLAVYTTDNRMFSTSCDLLISDFPVQDAAWIKICYHRDGRQMELYINLTGGDAP